MQREIKETRTYERSREEKAGGKAFVNLAKKALKQPETTAAVLLCTLSFI